MWGTQSRSRCKPRDCLRARDHRPAGWITPNNSEVDRPENLDGPGAERVRNDRRVARHGYWHLIRSGKGTASAAATALLLAARIRPVGLPTSELSRPWT